MARQKNMASVDLRDVLTDVLAAARIKMTDAIEAHEAAQDAARRKLWDALGSMGKPDPANVADQPTTTAVARPKRKYVRRAKAAPRGSETDGEPATAGKDND